MKAILSSILLLAVLAVPHNAAAQCRGAHRHAVDGVAVVAATLGVLNIIPQPQVGYYVAPAGPRYYRTDTDLMLYGSGARGCPVGLRLRPAVWR